MDGRTSTWVGLLALLLSSAGCVTTPNQNQGTAAPLGAGTYPGKPDPQVVVKKKEDGPKRNPHASTEVAYGQLKENEADSELGAKNPDVQARLREEARRAYQKALKVDPNYLDAQRGLARLYAKMGDYERAFDCYKTAMAKHPKDAALWYDLGLCHNRRKDFKESLPCFQKAVEFAPENRAYLKTLGFTLAWLGQFDQALAYLTRSQGSAMAHYNIAQVLLHHKQMDQAQQHLRQALRENPQYDQARELLTSLEAPATAALPHERPATP